MDGELASRRAGVVTLSKIHRWHHLARWSTWFERCNLREYTTTRLVEVVSKTMHVHF